MRLLEFTEEAKKDLAKLEKSTARQVFSKLRWLVENFDSLSQEPLTGDLKGFYKLDFSRQTTERREFMNTFKIILSVNNIFKSGVYSGK